MTLPTRSGTGAISNRLNDLPKVRDFSYLDGAEFTPMRTLGKDLVPVVSVMFTSLAEVAGVELSGPGAVLLAEEFTDELRAYPLEDLVLFLRRVSRGRYVKIYGKLSMPDLFRGWEKFDRERTDHLVRAHQRRKAAHNGEPTMAREEFAGAVVRGSRGRRADDIGERPKRTLEWVLSKLYGLPDERVAEILNQKTTQ